MYSYHITMKGPITIASQFRFLILPAFSVKHTFISLSLYPLNSQLLPVLYLLGPRWRWFVSKLTWFRFLLIVALQLLTLLLSFFPPKLFHFVKTHNYNSLCFSLKITLFCPYILVFTFSCVDLSSDPYFLLTCSACNSLASSSYC